jgi:hypothetical protein
LRWIVIALGAICAVSVALASLGFVYLYVGTLSGFFEWRDARNVRKLSTSTGRTIETELDRRLHALGVRESVKWSAACYGPVATVTACIGSESPACAAFEYAHGNEVLAGNPLARSLFPELKPRGIQYGTWLDGIGPEALDHLKGCGLTRGCSGRQCARPADFTALEKS